MKLPPLLLLLGLAACGGATNDQAANESATVDAVTAEAVSDTQAATDDATAAADAELDRLSNGVDEAVPVENEADRVSNTTAVTVY